MKNINVKEILKVAGLVILALALVFSVVFVDMIEWNNGFCECGGHWELVDIERTREDFFVRYFYQCENCGHIIDTITSQK